VWIIEGLTEYLERVDIYLGHLARYGVAVLPNAVAEFPLHIELGPFAYIPLGHLGLRAPEHKAVPFGAGLRSGSALGRRGRGLIGGKRECGNGATLDIINPRILPYVAYKYHFVYAHSGGGLVYICKFSDFLF